MSRKVLFHSTAFLDYVKLYEKYTLPSIVADVERLKADGYEIEYDRCSFGLEKLHRPEDTPTGNPISDVILLNLRKAIKRCIAENMVMFYTPPDTIFGAGTVYNAIKIVEDKPQSLAIPHLRLVQGAYPTWTPTNRELVKMCFDFPHKSFSQSFDYEDENSTWAGISMRKLDEDTYALTHSLPTIYVAKFTPQDAAFWDNMICFGNWDRGWLGMLMQQDRIKVVGSSDLCFCAEITREDQDVPPKYPRMRNNDTFFQEDHHNRILKKFVCMLKK